MFAITESLQVATLGTILHLAMVNAWFRGVKSRPYEYATGRQISCLRCKELKTIRFKKVASAAPIPNQK